MNNKRKTGAYVSWSKMKLRCNNKNHHCYMKYGGRGITYDPQWETFDNFILDMGNTWVNGLTLERVDVNGNYCKSNCKWATRREQAQNRRPYTDAVFFDLNGKKIRLITWCREVGLVYSSALQRYRRTGSPLLNV